MQKHLLCTFSCLQVHHILQTLHEVPFLHWFCNHHTPFIAALPESYYCTPSLQAKVTEQHTLTSTGYRAYTHNRSIIEYCNLQLKQHAATQTSAQTQDAFSTACAFSGGFVMHFPYPCSTKQQTYWVGEYVCWLECSTDQHTWQLYTIQPHATSTQLLCQVLYQKLHTHIHNRSTLFDTLCTSTISAFFFTRESAQLADQATPTFTPRWDKATYVSAFNRIQHYLREGDCYQVNLTQPFHTQQHIPLTTVFAHLSTLTQTPWSSYLNLSYLGSTHEILSFSPELFLGFNAGHQVITEPIKGTIKRQLEQPEIDSQLKTTLADSIKDKSENVMIVDLLRNDLSILAEPHSVKIHALFAIKSFSLVHHMVSQISATTKPTYTPFDVIAMSFPGGSITGAPKKRAMEIIEELEATPRGAYCGCMGFINYNQTGRTNILIRTLEHDETGLYLWAGGGITTLSNPDAEYEECFTKIKGIIDAIQSIPEESDSSTHLT